MAENHRRSGILEAAKMVPARTEVCLRQALHWNSLRAPRGTTQWAPRQVRAFETVRPAPFDERLVGLLLAPMPLVELGLAETFLELHLIARMADLSQK
jgi:hypothetical protein